MKLLTFEGKGGARVGAATSDGIVDLTGALGQQAGSLLEIIRAGIDIDAIGAQAIERLKKEGKLKDHVVQNPTFLPPILRPSKILALALNFREHIEETNLKFYEEPIVFTKYTSNMIGHDGEIELPPFPQKVDEEHELALVVGRECRHIRPHEAPDYIFGYTICNDVSARNRQRERGQMGQPYDYAKNFATFCPIGPWIVSSRELPDARNLQMTVRVNGKVTREGSTSKMIFDPYEVLAYCSDYTPMLPGDVISLGTFAGDKQLKAGDTVELEIERIGTLRNRVVAAKSAWRNFAEGVTNGPLQKER